MFITNMLAHQSQGKLHRQNRNILKFHQIKAHKEEQVEDIKKITSGEKDHK